LAKTGRVESHNRREIAGTAMAGPGWAKKAEGGCHAMCPSDWAVSDCALSLSATPLSSLGLFKKE